MVIKAFVASANRSGGSTYPQLKRSRALAPREVIVFSHAFLKKSYLDLRFDVDKLHAELKKVKTSERYKRRGRSGLQQDPERRWVDHLTDEDLTFLKRFLLASGTLKDLARQYGISYPTVRLRLDRLIDKVKLLDEHQGAGRLEARLRSLYADGRLDGAAFRELLRAHREQEEEREMSTR